MDKGLFQVYTGIYKDIFSKKGQLAILSIHKGLKKWEKIENLLLLLHFALTVTHTFNF